MKMALDKIAFLPFGKLIDQWRWGVFAGRDQAGRLQQGLVGAARASTRASRRRWRAREEDFDPGAKYHVPGNTPYTRYFLSFILQFQFHKALCEAAGFKGPLHECSIFGNKEAGKKYGAMLEIGASQPWQDTLEKLTGTREMDASAIIDYFQPLMAGWRSRTRARPAAGIEPGVDQMNDPNAGTGAAADRARHHPGRSCSR